MLLIVPKIVYSQTLSITKVQRDSIYNKIERGKINAERVLILKEEVKVLDSISTLKSEYIANQDFQIKSLNEIILNKNAETKNLNSIIDYEIKKTKRIKFWNFVKGIGFGVSGILILNAL